MSEPIPVPSFIITEAEIAEYVRPFAVDYGGKAINLRPIKALSVDDMLAAEKVAEDNILQALQMVAIDADTEAILKSMPHPLLFKVFAAWEATGDVSQGESDGSEGSSETTEPQ